MPPIRTSPALVELRRLSSRYGNEDTPGEELAAGALLTSRPAYWSVTGSTNALSYWRNEANIGGGIATVAVPEAHVRKFLDKLIPLNEAAVDELGHAYTALLSTWEDADDLRERAFNFVDTNALSVPVAPPAPQFLSREMEKING
jgi:hypothetical protein